MWFLDSRVRAVLSVVASLSMDMSVVCKFFFFFQAEDGIRDLVRSRGLGDVYKRQLVDHAAAHAELHAGQVVSLDDGLLGVEHHARAMGCLLYTSDAADERSSVDLGGRRIIKKKTSRETTIRHTINETNSMVETDRK